MTTSPSALDALLATLRTEDGAAKAHIDEGWMQGRTAYGGISSAVALAGTMALHPTETPLRYAQISFVGPVGGDCTVNTRVLRQSKSSLFVDAGVSSDQGFGTAAVFAFSGDRKSHLDHNRLTIPDAPAPETLAPVPDH
ncbi:MAG: thioesterase family protein, partial [Sphingopyxis sp.]|nr:thioesterase family protein [Sphingopyxis sp.]